MLNSKKNDENVSGGDSLCLMLEDSSSENESDSKVQPSKSTGFQENKKLKAEHVILSIVSQSTSHGAKFFKNKAHNKSQTNRVSGLSKLSETSTSMLTDDLDKNKSKTNNNNNHTKAQNDSSEISVISIVSSASSSGKKIQNCLRVLGIRNQEVF